MDELLGERLARVLAEHVTDDVNRLGVDRSTSAAHVVVWRAGELVADVAAGWAALEPERRALGADAVFDLASVTKVLVGATLVWQAIDEGRLAADEPLERLIAGWEEAPGYAPGATLLTLLNHTSGLAAWRKFYREWPVEPPLADVAAQRAAILDAARLEPRAYVSGQGYAYSDLGFMLLADVVERAFGAPLEVLAQARIFAPLGMVQTRYVSRRRGDTPLAGAVATERCVERGRVLVGEVHDENTAALGGVSAHAGVFSTARELALFGQHLLELDAGQRAQGIVSPQVVRWGWSREAGSAFGSHVAGWDTPSGARSSAGVVLSRERCVGHLGFTGTSIWIGRDSATVAVLLSNRVHPSRDNGRAHALRVAVHDVL